jgi:hypothetical protein
MDFNSFELTSYYVNLEILYQRYYFFESISKAWHTGKARLIGVRRLSLVELMFWVQGVTIKWYQSLGYDSEEFMKIKL